MTETEIKGEVLNFISKEEPEKDKVIHPDSGQR
jgi:hypothetical protein